MKFVPNGKTLDDGLKLLKSKIIELKENLSKKFENTMKATESNTPYVFKISDEKQRSSCVDTKASISKRNLKIIHGD